MNLVIMKGRFTSDPELRYSQNQKEIGTGNIAVKRDYVGQDGVESDFFNIVCFGKVAEFITKYFTRGQEILITGKVQNRQWEDKDGNKRQSTDIVVEKAEFVGSKNSSSSNNKQTNKPSKQEDVYGDDSELPF